MSAGSKLLLLGLRGSGKTSYLAALWHLIEAGELPSSLVASQLQPNREYLNRIRDSWLRFQEVGRTPLRGQETLSLVLSEATTGSTIEITLPDLSGESYRLQWAMRKVTSRYAQFASDTSGVMLFIHPSAVKRTHLIPLPIKDAVAAARKRNKQPGVSVKKSEPVVNAERTKQWSPDLSSTQVQLVELLQFVNWLRSANKPARIAVIVSAWDLVHDSILPVSWVENRLPLLFQFLVANAHVLPFRTYGISALGGDLEKDLALLQNQVVPANRIRVVGDNIEPHNDLTVPIRFLLGLESKEPRLHGNKA